MVGREGRERVGKRQPIRQKFVGGIEAAPPDHVLINVPANPLGGLDATANFQFLSADASAWE